MTQIRTLVVVTCLAAAFWPAEANAQRRYQPPRPTFSPYHDLFRRDNGLLDPYNAHVVPRRRAAQQINQMQRTINTQQSEIESLNQQALQFGEVLAQPTGTGATFMNYSHFYGNDPSRSAGTAAGAGRSAGGRGRSSGGRR